MSAAGRAADRAADRVAALWAIPARISLLPLGLRAATGAVAFTTLYLALPALWVAAPITLIVAAILALMCAAVPASRTPLVTILAAAGGWFVATTGYGEPVDVLRAAVLTALMYLLHQLATLAAALPYDAVVARDTVTRWFGRTLAIAAGSALVAAVVLAALPGTGAPAGGYVVATAAGLVATIAVLLLLARARPR